MLGFIFIFVNLFFVCIFMVFLGGGDEVYVLYVIFGNGENCDLIYYIGFGFVLVVVVFFLVIVWRVIVNWYCWLYFFGFLVLLMLLVMLVIFMGLNGLLEKGVLFEFWIWGILVLVIIYIIVVVIVVSLINWYLVELCKNE